MKAFKKEKVDCIIKEILDNKKIFKDIANDLNINISSVCNINIGKTHKRNNLNYPLRKCNLTKEKANQAKEKAKHKKEKIYEIVNDLINASIPLKDMAFKYNIDFSTVCKINSGDSYCDKKLNYPLRATKYSIKK